MSSTVPWPKGVNVAFKELVHKILEHNKNKPYFRWPGKIGGEPAKRNQNLYCTYHLEKGHTTEQCQLLKVHLEQLVKSRCLKEFIVGQGGGTIGLGSRNRGNTLPSPLGIIEVIHVASIGVNISR